MFAQPSDEFYQFSARCGRDPLRVQGAGGNTSIKHDNILWIKASGTELAQATEQMIFVPVDRHKARQEALGLLGDGSCQSARLDPRTPLRPSIETTFHAYIDWPVVAHTHSVATLVHAICAQGQAAAKDKLQGLPFAWIEYQKPGLPLTRAIMAQSDASCQIMLLQNHGLIVAGDSVAEVAALMDEVEQRLQMPRLVPQPKAVEASAPAGFRFYPPASSLAQDPRLSQLASAGSYYPDHVVFLGSGLSSEPAAQCAAFQVPPLGVALSEQATDSQRAMLDCLEAILSRVPSDWQPQTLSTEQEAALLNWDAEKYRQALAKRPSHAAMEP